MTLARLPGIDFGGSLDEASPKNRAKFITVENWRTGESRTTKKKREGLSKLDSIYDFSTKNVYGVYGIGEVDEVDILACLEDDVQLKSGGAWSSVFSPTKTIDKPVSVVKEKGLTIVTGYEKPITIKEGSAFYSGIESPNTPPTVAAQAGSSGIKVVEYPTANQDHVGKLRYANAHTILAQSFQIETDNEVSKVTLKLKKIGSPTGNMWAEIHSSQAGTSATKDASTNIVGEASDNLDVSTTTTAFASYDFDFSGTKPSLSADTTYYLVIYGSFTVSGTAFVEIGYDTNTPTYSNGQYWMINNSLVWSNNNNVDLVFEIYGEGATSGELKSVGAKQTGDYYSLRNSSSNTLLAQSFQLSSASEINSVKLALKKGCLWDVYRYLCPTGNVWAEIHSSTSGTSGTKNASSNIVGQASDNVSVSSIAQGFGWIEFTFSGTKPSLSASTTYYIVLYGSFTIDSDKNIEWTVDSGNPYSDGEAFTINGSMSWTTKTGFDFSFQLYGTGTATAVIEEYDLDNLNTIYELRENAAMTLMAQSFVAPSDATIYSAKLYLSKLGAPAGNVWVEIHSAQGGTSASAGASTAIVGEESNTVAITGVNSFDTYAQHEFVFGATQPVLTAGNTYYLVVYASYSVSATVHVKVGMDKVAPEFSNGSAWKLDGSLNWTEIPNVDLLFELLAASGMTAGDYSYVVTFYRGGNYPCESNPSNPTEDVSPTAGQEVVLSNIPVSSESEVTARRVYRTKANLSVYYYLGTIEDNSTTSYTDNLPDSSLGSEVGYESYPPPAGDGIEIWDERAWVWGVPDYPEALFKSGQGTLEQFPTPASQFYALREDETDEIKQGIAYLNNFFVLKRNSIWYVYKDGEDYGQDKIYGNTGTVAKRSVAECMTKNGRALIFLSNHFKIEILRGFNLEYPRVSDAVQATLATINKEYAYRSSAVNNVDKGEYRLAIPTGSATYPNKVIVYDYIHEEFYIDTYFSVSSQKLTSLSLADISTSERAVIYGTDAGELEKVDKDATTDDGEPIISTLQTGWIDSSAWKTLRRAWLNLILDEDATLVFKVYENYKEAPTLDINITGNYPTGADQTIREIMKERINLAVRGYTFMLEFINAEDVTYCELLDIELWARSQRYKQSIATT